jgi:hypothetical protein
VVLHPLTGQNEASFLINHCLELWIHIPFCRKVTSLFQELATVSHPDIACEGRRFWTISLRFTIVCFLSSTDLALLGTPLLVALPLVLPFVSDEATKQNRDLLVLTKTLQDLFHNYDISFFVVCYEIIPTTCLLIADFNRACILSFTTNLCCPVTCKMNGRSSVSLWNMIQISCFLFSSEDRMTIWARNIVVWSRWCFQLTPVSLTSRIVNFVLYSSYISNMR